jgi:hypothetical protein
MRRRKNSINLWQVLITTSDAIRIKFCAILRALFANKYIHDCDMDHFSHLTGEHLSRTERSNNSPVGLQTLEQRALCVCRMRLVPLYSCVCKKEFLQHHIYNGDGGAQNSSVGWRNSSALTPHPAKVPS